MDSIGAAAACKMRAPRGAAREVGWLVGCTSADDAKLLTTNTTGNSEESAQCDQTVGVCPTQDTEGKKGRESTSPQLASIIWQLQMILN